MSPGRWRLFLLPQLMVDCFAGATDWASVKWFTDVYAGWASTDAARCLFVPFYDYHRDGAARTLSIAGLADSAIAWTDRRKYLPDVANTGTLQPDYCPSGGLYSNRHRQIQAGFSSSPWSVDRAILRCVQ